jgi:hypothetical protein
VIERADQGLGVVVGYGQFARVALGVRDVAGEERGQGLCWRVVIDEFLEVALLGLPLGAGTVDCLLARRIEVKEAAGPAVAAQWLAIVF